MFYRCHLHQPKKSKGKSCCNFLTNLIEHNLQKILLMTLLVYAYSQKTGKISLLNCIIAISW